jgi:hypothetical protein
MGDFKSLALHNHFASDISSILLEGPEGHDRDYREIEKER